ncbi:hypothetical protein [Nonomuraea pusilla]|nr:hypothetical protein [Nonomuraea pusilla]
MRDDRTALVHGLIDLAVFLVANPDLPVTASVTARYIADGDDDAELRAEIDRIAARLGTAIDEADLPYGHYTTSISFGPVEYRAVAILAAARARYDAQNSHRDNN